MSLWPSTEEGKFEIKYSSSHLDAYATKANVEKNLDVSSKNVKVRFFDFKTEATHYYLNREGSSDQLEIQKTGMSSNYIYVIASIDITLLSSLELALAILHNAENSLDASEGRNIGFEEEIKKVSRIHLKSKLLLDLYSIENNRKNEGDFELLSSDEEVTLPNTQMDQIDSLEQDDSEKSTEELLNYLDRIAVAQKILVETKYFAQDVKNIYDVVDKYHKLPRVFGDPFESYNALVRAGVENREVLDNLIQDVSERRRLIPEARRRDYQRELMRERRERIRKSTELEELLRGRMTPRNRKSFAIEAQRRWHVDRDRFIAAQGDQSWAGRNTATQNFWREFDRSLDEKLAVERARKS